MPAWRAMAAATAVTRSTGTAGLTATVTVPVVGSGDRAGSVVVADVDLVVDHEVVLELRFGAEPELATEALVHSDGGHAAIVSHCGRDQAGPEVPIRKRRSPDAASGPSALPPARPEVHDPGVSPMRIGERRVVARAGRHPPESPRIDRVGGSGRPRRQGVRQRDAGIRALDGVDVDIPAAPSPPSWGRPDRASRPSCTAWRGSTPSRRVRSSSADSGSRRHVRAGG